MKKNIKPCSKNKDILEDLLQEYHKLVHSVMQLDFALANLKDLRDHLESKIMKIKVKIKEQ